MGRASQRLKNMCLKTICLCSNPSLATYQLWKPAGVPLALHAKMLICEMRVTVVPSLVIRTESIYGKH